MPNKKDTLNKQEAADLKRLVETIETAVSGIRSARDAYEKALPALEEIKERRLWRGESESFSGFCQARFDISPKTIYRHLKMLGLRALPPPGGNGQPAKTVAATVTTADASEPAAPMSPQLPAGTQVEILCDCEDIPITREDVEVVFRDAAAIDVFVSVMRRLETALAAISDACMIEIGQKTTEQAKLAGMRRRYVRGRPFAVCPEHLPADYTKYNERGWLTLEQAEALRKLLGSKK